jgi:hypothetical protein
MRRRPPSRGSSSPRRAAANTTAAPSATSDSFTLVLSRLAHGAIHCSAGAGSRDPVKDSEEVRCRVLQDAIDQISRKFEEAQQEYQGLTTNSPDWHKWKGEMIAYANVVAVLEDLKSRAVLVR